MSEELIYYGYLVRYWNRIRGGYHARLFDDLKSAYALADKLIAEKVSFNPSVHRINYEQDEVWRNGHSKKTGQQ